MAQEASRPPLTAEAFDGMMNRTMTIKVTDLPSLGVGVFRDQDGRPLLTIGDKVVAVIPYAFEAIREQMDRYLARARAEGHQEGLQG